MNELLARIRETLIVKSDESTRLGSLRFFKEAVTVHGVKVAIVQKISREFFSELKDKPKSEILALCEKLWQSGYLEELLHATGLSGYKNSLNLQICQFSNGG